MKHVLSISTGPWEWRVAAHESGHVVVAYFLGLNVKGCVITKHGEVSGGAGLGSADCLETSLLTDATDIARARAAVFMAGTIAGAIAEGLAYNWIEYSDAVFLAAEYRSRQRREIVTNDIPRVKKWNIPPDGRDPVAVSIWVHSGRNADMSFALENIEKTAMEIQDVGERDAARHGEFDIAQSTAFRICRAHITTIVKLSDSLFHSGSLTAEEIAGFFRGIEGPYTPLVTGPSRAKGGYPHTATSTSNIASTYDTFDFHTKTAL